MTVDLYAGIAVREIEPATAWFSDLFGSEPFEPDDTERVWTLSEHCHVYVERRPDRAGRSIVTVFVDDFETFVEDAAGRGVAPETRETYGNGVRKAVFRDPDGNEIGIGGAPA